MPVLLPYLIGVITAPLAAKIIKPLFRGVVKTTVGVAMEVKRVAADAGEELQDIAAEVSVENVAADKATKTPRAGVVTTKETSAGVVSSRGTDVTR